MDLPSHLVVELISLSEFVPWYDLVQLKVVSKEWHDAIDTTLVHNSAWKPIVDWLNAENRLHECYYCCRPLARDGSTTSICNQTCCSDVQGYFLKMQQAANPYMQDPRAVGEILTEKSNRNTVPLFFGDLDVHRQAQLLFRYHHATIKALLNKYGTEGQNSLGRRCRNSHVNQAVSLIVAKERLNNSLERRDTRRSHAVSLSLEMACQQVDLIGRHEQLCRVFFETNNVDVAPSNMIARWLENRRCETADRLFGPKLARSIDILADIRDEMAYQIDLVH
jgi:hypothetical protein